jgi:predicted SprT family Zn-dependent metalloprotease
MNAVTEQDVGMCDELCHLLFYCQNKGGFTKPDNWQHVDHLIPEIYAEWLKYQYDHSVVKIEIKEENDDGEEIEEGMEED